MNLIADNFFWVLFLAGFNLVLAVSGYIADKVNGPEGDRESPLGGASCPKEIAPLTQEPSTGQGNKRLPSV